MIKVLFFLLTIVSITFSSFFVIPKKNEIKGYKSVDSKKSLTVDLEKGKIYVALKEKGNRVLLKDKKIWVDKSDIVYDKVKDVVLYKFKYYCDYQKELQKERERIENVIKTHKYLPDSILVHIKKSEVVPNWPESLVVLSWGKPDTIFRSVKNGKKYTEIKYGINRLILINDSLKYTRKKSEKNLKFMLKQ